MIERKAARHWMNLQLGLEHHRPSSFAAVFRPHELVKTRACPSQAEQP